MASNISEEEFLRLQNQIIELKTANYNLEEQHALQISRNKQLQSQVEVLDRECDKAHSFVSQAKKLKNADLIVQNERLQQKIQAQEDEFRLQNQTLLQEISTLSQEKQRITKIAHISSKDSSKDCDEQVMKLKSEASAFQRALSEERLRSAQEISRLKSIIYIFTDGIGEELQSEVIGNNSLDSTEKCIDKSDMRISDEKGSDEGNDKEEYEKVQDIVSCELKNELKLVSTCSLAALELEDVILEDDKAEEEKRIIAENRYMELQKAYTNYQSEAVKKMGDLEDTLQLMVGEQEKQRCVNSELKSQVEQLRNKINECNLENKVVQTKLAKSMENVEELNLQLAALRLEKQEKDKILAQAEEREQCLSEEMERLRSESDLRVEALGEQLADREAEQCLREKKGAVVCRDLKRQLAAERRRVERLQDRMREVLEGTSLKIGNESSKGTDVDTTSLSSWSLMSGNNEQQDSSTRESSIVAASPINLNGNPDELDLEQESRNLLERVASLQEEKWALEEKVNHLEQGNSELLQDLIQKNKVIQFYCMEGYKESQPCSSGKKAVKILSDLLKTSEGYYLQESNTRMQRMLEELLTKNMFLQRDVEELTKEIDKLLGLAKPAE